MAKIQITQKPLAHKPAKLDGAVEKFGKPEKKDRQEMLLKGFLQLP